MANVYLVACLQSRDSDAARNSVGGQEVKSRKDEMESPYCTGLDTITRERYKQKIKTYVGRNSYVMNLCYLPAIEAVDISN